MKLPRDLAPPLVDALCERFKALTDLVERTGLGQANVSRHLQQLMSTGFIRRRKEGTFAFYSLADDDVLKLCEIMCGRIDADARERRQGLRAVR
jgi:DNA-binding transcriptional ArsR family regulator